MVVLLREADQVMVAIFCRPSSRFDHNGGTQPPRERTDARSPIMNRIWHPGGSFHHSCLDNEAADGKFPLACAMQHEGARRKARPAVGGNGAPMLRCMAAEQMPGGRRWRSRSSERACPKHPGHSIYASGTAT